MHISIFKLMDILRSLQKSNVKLNNKKIAMALIHQIFTFVRLLRTLNVAL